MLSIHKCSFWPKKNSIIQMNYQFTLSSLAPIDFVYKGKSNPFLKNKISACWEYSRVIWKANLKWEFIYFLILLANGRSINEVNVTPLKISTLKKITTYYSSRIKSTCRTLGKLFYILSLNFFINKVEIMAYTSHFFSHEYWVRKYILAVYDSVSHLRSIQ